MHRREFLKSAAAVALFPAQRPSAMTIVDAGGSNVLCVNTGDGVVVVDSGAPNAAASLIAAIKSFAGDARIHALFNTHYHLDQTANNETLAAAGARIIAHQHTRQWMSTDYWVPSANRYEHARAKAAWPTDTFRVSGSLSAGSERIDYGHLPLAHTDGDIYVFFRDANVLAVGDVGSPLRDPALDYFTGAWIGGRIDAMDTILRLSDDATRIVPAAGAAMTRAEFKNERDMMEEVRGRIWARTLKGDSPKEMLDGGLLNGLPRTWKDPYKFLYDAAQGMFAHHNKLDPSVI